jgi:hypothetical protein
MRKRGMGMGQRIKAPKLLSGDKYVSHPRSQLVRQPLVELRQQHDAVLVAA